MLRLTVNGKTVSKLDFINYQDNEDVKLLSGAFHRDAFTFTNLNCLDIGINHPLACVGFEGSNINQLIINDIDLVFIDKMDYLGRLIIKKNISKLFLKSSQIKKIEGLDYIRDIIIRY